MVDKLMLINADRLLQTPYKDILIQKMATPNYPYPLSTVFLPSTSPPTPLSKRTAITPGESTPSSLKQPESLNGQALARTLGPHGNGNGNGNGHGSIASGSSPPDRVNGLRLVDFRYARFVLEHGTGLFKMLRYVKQRH